MKNLRLGIIGAGGIMRERHWPNLKKLPSLSISCVCNSTQESAAKFLHEIDVKAEVESDWKQIIHRKDVDVVWVAAPPFLHKPTVLECLRIGKPVFCQARMAMDYAEAEEMHAAHLKAPSVVAAFCAAPFGMTVSNYVKKLLSSGELGDLIHINFQSLTNMYCDPHAPAHWRQRREINGINFLSCGIFAEVVMDWLGEPSKISATGSIVHKQRGAYTIKLPDIVTVQAVWPDGSSGSLTWSGVHFGKQRPELRIQGTKAAMTVLFQPDEIRISTDNNTNPVIVNVPPHLQSEWRVEEDFIDAVRGKNVKPGISFQEGLRYMRFTQAVIDSFESQGAWINLSQKLFA